MDPQIQVLIDRYGPVGYLSNALHDSHIERLNIGAPINGGAHEHISGIVSDTYNSISDSVKRISWKLLIQAGNVPNDLDAMIKHLQNIGQEVRKKLKASLKWIGDHLNAIWDYIKQFLPGDWFSGVLQSLSFDWLVSNITTAIKYTARQLASGLAVVFETLRDVIYNAIGTIVEISGGIMEAIYKSPSMGKQKIIHALYFYMSSSADFTRYVNHTYHTMENRMQAFKGQVADITSGIIEEAVPYAAELDPLIQDTWDFKAAFGVGESIVAWISEYMSWFVSTLKRLVSSARACFDATLSYAYLFTIVLGPQLQKVMEYVKESTDPVPLVKAKENVEDLLNASGIKLSQTRREQLQRAVDVSEDVIDDMRLQNERIVVQRDNVKHSTQYEMNHAVATVLTQLHNEDENFDKELMNSVIKFYSGRELVDQYAIARETTNYLETQYILAISEILGERFEPIGPPAKGGVKSEAQKKEDAEFEQAETERGEEAITTFGLQERFERAERDLQDAHDALIAFELAGTESRFRRDVLYFETARKMEENLNNQSQFMSIVAAETTRENMIQQMSLMIIDRSGIGYQEKYFLAFSALHRAFKERQRLAILLDRRMKAPNWWKGNLSVAACIIGIAVPFTFYTLLAIYANPTPIFSGPPVDPVYYKTGKEVLYDWLVWLKDKTPGFNTAFSSVSIIAGLNPTTWYDALVYFSTVDALKVLDFPKLFEYMAIWYSAVPATIVFGLFTYMTVICFGSMIIDCLYGLGVKSRDVNGRAVYTKNRAQYYMSTLGKVFGIVGIDLFTRATSLWMALYTGKIENMKHVMGAILPAVITGINPMRYITEGAVISLPDENAATRALRVANLLPDNNLIQKITNPENFEFIHSTRIWTSMVDLLKSLPPNHPLITGSHLVAKVREPPKTDPFRDNNYEPLIKQKDDEEKEEVNDFVPRRRLLNK